MSNHNRFLIPQHNSNINNNNNNTSLKVITTTPTKDSPMADSSSSSSSCITAISSNSATTTTVLNSSSSPIGGEGQENNQPCVDTDFDSYWEEEARNPNRNRIRIGRQYQATVPPLLKPGETDKRKLEDLETLTFCPKKSSHVSDSELTHYLTVAKSLNLFASLVETRSLLGRDVTIADLNFIRRKEGLSLASVIQPARQATTNHGYSNPSSTSPLATQSSNPSNATSTTTSSTSQVAQQSPQNNCERSPSTSSSPKDPANTSSYTLNQPLMKALSHFISLHHSCHHDSNCKKLLKNFPLDDDPMPTVSITAGNLRQGSSSSKESKLSRSRSSTKQQASSQVVVKEEATPLSSLNTTEKDQDESQQPISDSVQSPTFDDWTREEVELFSKAIEVCGKNFSSIKKEFLPSKSVKSIVEYYYIGSRDSSESKKKSSQHIESGERCNSPEKLQGICSNTSGTNEASPAGKTSSTISDSNPTLVSSNLTSKQSSSNRTSTLTTPINKIDLNGQNKQAKTTSSNPQKLESSLKQTKSESIICQDLNGLKSKTSTKNVDPRLSVYNFDEELRDDLSPVRFECPRPGAEVKPLKAKPIIPNTASDCDPSNSNVGSLKFFMDGELVLKLNACQEQQEGIEKCHWVQSGERVSHPTKQKRYSKRASDKSSDPNSSQNGSHSNSIISSYQDDESTRNDLSGDEDSKESMNSFTNLPQHHKNNLSPPVSKRQKLKNEPGLQVQQQQLPHHLQQQQQQQLQPIQQQQQTKLPQPINYNRLALNNRMKDRVVDSMSPNPMITQAMPWLQANSFAVAAALFGGIPFPQPPQTAPVPTSNTSTPLPQLTGNSLSSKPMDLSVEHTISKPLPKTSSRSSRSRPKNNH